MPPPRSSTAAEHTSTFALLQYRQTFQQMNFGPGAAIATLTLIALALLGLLGAVLTGRDLGTRQ